jgi:hypothetical protein
MQRLGRQQIVAFLSAVGVTVLAVAALLFVSNRGTYSPVHAAGSATPTPTSSIAPLVQMVHIDGIANFNATTTQLIVSQHTFVAGKGALELQVHIELNDVSDLTESTDAYLCQAYLDDPLLVIGRDSVAYDASKVGTTRSLSGTVPLTKGTHTVYLWCSTSGHSTTNLRTSFDMVVVTGATSFSFTGRG